MLAVIDRKGEEGSQLKKPYGVYVDSNNILYVTEYGVVIQCVCSVLVDNFLDMSVIVMALVSSDHRFITSDQYGKLYISDSNGVHMY